MESQMMSEDTELTTGCDATDQFLNELETGERYRVPEANTAFRITGNDYGLGGIVYVEWEGEHDSAPGVPITLGSHELDAATLMNAITDAWVQIDKRHLGRGGPSADTAGADIDVAGDSDDATEDDSDDDTGDRDAPTDGGEWDPEPATLRDGERREDTHALRNAEQLRVGGVDPDDDDANPGGEPMTDGGEPRPVDDDGRAAIVSAPVLATELRSDARWSVGTADAVVHGDDSERSRSGKAGQLARFTESVLDALDALPEDPADPLYLDHQGAVAWAHVFADPADTDAKPTEYVNVVWAVERGEPITDGGEDIPAGHEYDTKTVRVHIPDRGKYVYLMMTQFDGEGGILAREGWGGTYVWFSVISRNEQACVSGADPWALSRRYPGEWFADSAASALMKDMDMDRVQWSDITDGAHLTPEDVTALAGGDGDD